VAAAGACAAAVAAQFIAGKVARDALYLASLAVTSLPLMVVVTSVFSVALVAASSTALRHVSPARFVPAMFIASGALLFVEWVVALTAPRIAAPLVYLHVSGLGPMLASGFWLIATERFDPHTAKKRFGQVAGMGTVGGLLGGLLAERVAAMFGAAAILLLLALLNVMSAWLVRRLAPPSDERQTPWVESATPDLAAEAPRSGLRVLAATPYLRSLAALVLLGTVGASIIDYLFKAQAVEALGRGVDLGRFFAIYYTGISLVAFVIQISVNSTALERLGLATVVSTPAIALLTGSVGGLIAPGLESIAVVRGGESVLRASLYRSAYEIFYTPVSAADRRAAKSLIDVGFDRFGDAVGGGLVRLALFAVPAFTRPALFGLTIGCALAALAVASRLNRGYLATLERSLLDRALEMDLTDTKDLATRTVLLRTMSALRADTHPPGANASRDELDAGFTDGRVAAVKDPVLADIAALRSNDEERVLRILRRDDGIEATLVAHAIPLLAWDAVANDALHALRKVSEERIGEFIDALIDPNQPFAVRRRLARAFSVCVSQRAVDGLFLGLDDSRFEVRFQCGRSLVAIHERNPIVHIDKDRTVDVVLREVAVSRPVWESHRLLDHVDDAEPKTFVDDFLKARSNQSLAHVFGLLSLVLPAEPLRVAFRGLHATDQNLRGTALEYLDAVLPPRLRERLWPFLDIDSRVDRLQRPREAILADLFRLNESVLLNVKALEVRTKVVDSATGTETDEQARVVDTRKTDR
jgi:hypothetical protein